MTNRFLIVQLADIGDLILTTPALSALREKHPDAMPRRRSVVVDVGDPPLFRICDMPGYGYAKAPIKTVQKWRYLVNDYLRGRQVLKRAFLLVDSRHGIKEVDREIMKMLDGAAVSYRIVLTKADLCDDVDARLAAAQAVLPAGAVAIALNALGDEPAGRLEPWLGAGQTSVMLGSSGAGKSTLTNALVGHEAQRTQANRAGDNRGRHTTTARVLHRVAAGGCIIDTPGLRTLRLDGDAKALEQVFDDIAERAASCRFRDCRHENEPGCAVRGTVPEERLRNWAKLQREARRDTLTALERKAQVSMWKARARGARVRMQAKRG